MKATGIVRGLDSLGRLCIPKEIRKVHNIDLLDPVEIFTEGENIILRKYQRTCVICGEVTESEFKGKLLCKKCRDGLRRECSYDGQYFKAYFRCRIPYPSFMR